MNSPQNCLIRELLSHRIVPTKEMCGSTTPASQKQACRGPRVYHASEPKAGLPGTPGLPPQQAKSRLAGDPRVYHPSEPKAGLPGTPDTTAGREAGATLSRIVRKNAG